MEDIFIDKYRFTLNLQFIVGMAQETEVHIRSLNYTMILEKLSFLKRAKIALCLNFCLSIVVGFINHYTIRPIGFERNGVIFNPEDEKLYFFGVEVDDPHFSWGGFHWFTLINVMLNPFYNIEFFLYLYRSLNFKFPNKENMPGYLVKTDIYPFVTSLRFCSPFVFKYSKASRGINR
jgi:hypothetical protein